MDAEQTERLRRTIETAKAKLERMERCHETMVGLLHAYQDFLWSATAHSGPRLFEAEQHLRIELKRARQWIAEKSRWLPHEDPLPKVR